MRLVCLAAWLVFVSSAAAQPRRPACDPVGYPPEACGRLPDGCGGFVDLMPCPEPARLEIHDVGLWTLGVPPSPTPPFATDLGAPSRDVSCMFLYSTTPLDTLRVAVRYRSGRAGWAYPTPSRRGRLQWDRLAAPPPDGGPWTTLALGVAMEPTAALRHNGVLMHGGASAFASPIVVRGGRVRSARGEHTVWTVTADGFEERRVVGHRQEVIASGDSAALRRRVTEELVRAGLYPREADALFDAQQQRAPETPYLLYMLPRPSIDRAQGWIVAPSRPETTTIVRVRLVEDHR